MRYGGYHLNPSGSNLWVEAVGKLILNFGAIETQTYFWLVQLRRKVPLDRADMQPFSDRVNKILKLSSTDSNASPHLTDVEQAWNEAKELAKFRNRIAHSPIMSGWNSPDESGPPDFLHILDFKQAGEKSPKNTIIEIEEINMKIDEIARVGWRLDKLYQSIWHS